MSHISSFCQKPKAVLLFGRGGVDVFFFICGSLFPKLFGNGAELENRQQYHKSDYGGGEDKISRGVMHKTRYRIGAVFVSPNRKEKRAQYIVDEGEYHGKNDH